MRCATTPHNCAAATIVLQPGPPWPRARSCSRTCFGQRGRARRAHDERRGCGGLGWRRRLCAGARREQRRQVRNLICEGGIQLGQCVDPRRLCGVACSPYGGVLLCVRERIDELHDVRQRGLRTAIGDASVSTAAWSTKARQRRRSTTCVGLPMSVVPKPPSVAHALPVAVRSTGAPSVLAVADDEAANAENSTRVPNPRPTSMLRSPTVRDAVACSPSEAATRRQTRRTPCRADCGGNNMPHTPQHSMPQSPVVLC
jgi:hypothetical protein